MSRAFVKEPDEGQGEELPERPQSPHPNYVTPSGLRDLQARVAELAAQRARLAAAEDLASRQQLPSVARDLRYYEERIERAIVVDPESQDEGRVHFGATVEVLDDSGKVERFAIVGEDEADAPRGRISWVSPLAKALLRAEPGDRVVWKRPAGDKELEILSIRKGTAG